MKMQIGLEANVLGARTHTHTHTHIKEYWDQWNGKLPDLHRTSMIAIAKNQTSSKKKISPKATPCN
jgi:hypothetical protein